MLNFNIKSLLKTRVEIIAITTTTYPIIKGTGGREYLTEYFRMKIELINK